MDASITIVRIARVLTYLVYAFVLISLVILVLGFFLLLFGANPDAPFVAWAYRSLDRAMEPFRGIFTPIDLNVSANDDIRAVLDTSVLFAMLVYAVAAWAVHALMQWLTDQIRHTEAQRVPVAAPPAPPPPSRHAAPPAPTAASWSETWSAGTPAPPAVPRPGPSGPPPAGPPPTR